LPISKRFTNPTGTNSGTACSATLEAASNAAEPSSRGSRFICASTKSLQDWPQDRPYVRDEGTCGARAHRSCPPAASKWHLIGPESGVSDAERDPPQGLHSSHLSASAPASLSRGRYSPAVAALTLLVPKPCWRLVSCFVRPEVSAGAFIRWPRGLIALRLALAVFSPAPRVRWLQPRLYSRSSGIGLCSSLWPRACGFAVRAMPPVCGFG